MGCDIHGWIERRVGDKWIAVRELNERSRKRNYELFGALAQVRGGTGCSPHGFPDDAGVTTKLHFEDDGADAHSASFMPCAEALPLFVNYSHGLTDWDNTYPENAFFEFYETTELANHRIVFWFDN